MGLTPQDIPYQGNIRAGQRFLCALDGPARPVVISHFTIGEDNRLALIARDTDTGEAATHLVDDFRRHCLRLPHTGSLAEATNTSPPTDNRRCVSCRKDGINPNCMSCGSGHGEVLWWCSFCDLDRPEGQRFIGVTLVPAHNVIQATEVAHALFVNPGGQVQFGGPFPLDAYDREWVGRLLSREDIDDMPGVDW